MWKCGNNSACFQIQWNCDAKQYSNQWKKTKPWEFETLKHVKMQKQSISWGRFATRRVDSTPVASKYRMKNARYWLVATGGPLCMLLLCASSKPFCGSGLQCLRHLLWNYYLSYACYFWCRNFIYFSILRRSSILQKSRKKYVRISLLPISTKNMVLLIEARGLVSSHRIFIYI